MPGVPRAAESRAVRIPLVVVLSLWAPWALAAPAKVEIRNVERDATPPHGTPLR